VRKTSGRHRDRARADRFATGDVVRGVADHIDVRWGKINRVFFPRAQLRERPELVPIVMVVGEGAELEEIPDAVVRELQLRAPPQIAGQETEDILRSRSQAKQQFLHSRQERSLASWQFTGQKFDIEIEERGRCLFARFNLLFPQNLVDDAGIGLPGDFHAVQIVGNAELLLQHSLERLDAGAAGINQRAVNVEKEKAFGN
jgi:hypothetical protein